MKEITQNFLTISKLYTSEYQIREEKIHFKNLNVEKEIVTAIQEIEEILKKNVK